MRTKAKMSSKRQHNSASRKNVFFSTSRILISHNTLLAKEIQKSGNVDMSKVNVSRSFFNKQTRNNKQFARHLYITSCICRPCGTCVRCYVLRHLLFPWIYCGFGQKCLPNELNVNVNEFHFATTCFHLTPTGQ